MPAILSATATPFHVALTFDAEHPDRPAEPDAELRLLDALDRLALRASFFLQGRWVDAYPERARRIAEAGHLVGNHGHYHARMPLLNEVGLDKDIAAAEATIVATTGVDPKPWFRCPFGAGGDDPRVQARVELAGYRHVGWDVEGEDWERGLTAEALEDAVVERVAARRAEGAESSIVLLHTWPTPTAAAIEGIATRLSDDGATLVRLDGLPMG
jgi:peptidoglycan/xylan/chitin deacetylase (PgdA/CDA1 family)